MFVRLILVVAALTVVVAYGARQGVGSTGQKRSTDQSSAGEVRYTVKAGDTLWSIASSHYGGDPREGVWRLQERNRLAGAHVTPGQSLVLP